MSVKVSKVRGKFTRQTATTQASNAAHVAPRLTVTHIEPTSMVHICFDPKIRQLNFPGDEGDHDERDGHGEAATICQSTNA